MGLGQFASESKFTILEEDIYTGSIVSAKMDTDDAGAPKADKFGKYRLILKVRVDGVTDDEGEPVDLRRSLAISYGKNNQTQKWADLARLIEITFGIPCGDKQQGNIDADDFRGKPVRFKTINVEKDGKTFTNIESFMPVAKNGAPRATAPAGMAQRRPAPAPVHHDDAGFPEENLGDDDLPF